MGVVSQAVRGTMFERHETAFEGILMCALRRGPSVNYFLLRSRGGIVISPFVKSRKICFTSFFSGAM